LHADKRAVARASVASVTLRGYIAKLPELLQKIVKISGEHIAL
jgi:hypothetical protein